MAISCNTTSSFPDEKAKSIDGFYGILEAGFLEYASVLHGLEETNKEFSELLLHEEIEDWETWISQYRYANMSAPPPLPLALASRLWKRYERKPKLMEGLKPFEKELNPEKHAGPFIAACDAIPKADLTEYIRKSIDETDIKCFWERHFNRINIERIVSNFSLELGEEYDEKLRHIDDFRKGESLGFPYIEPMAEGGEAQMESDDTLVSKLVFYFKDEDTTRRFLQSIRGQKDTEITSLVNHYWEVGAIRKGTKKTHLWKALHYAGLYKALESNWNAMVDFKMKR